MWHFTVCAELGLELHISHLIQTTDELKIVLQQKRSVT